jgi:hypothetical protein
VCKRQQEQDQRRYQQRYRQMPVLHDLNPFDSLTPLPPAGAHLFAIRAHLFAIHRVASRIEREDDLIAGFRQTAPPEE